MATQDTTATQTLQSEEVVESSVSAALLPNGWKEVRLGDVCDMTMGQSPPSETYNSEGRGMPFLQGKAEFTDLYPRATMYCDERGKIAPATSVLMSVRAPVGDVNMADKPYIIGRGLSALSLREGDNSFLFYSLLHNQKRIAALGSGTTFQSINRAVIDAFRIQLPPLPEQRAVARALRAVQDAIQARRREVKLERERKAALMQQLFTHGTRGEPTKQTEIGEMPESWQVVYLGDYAAKPEYGFTASANRKPVGPQFLRITDIQETGVDWATVPYCECDDKTRQTLRLMPGDVVIARIGATTGKSFLIRECPEAVFASYLIRVRVSEGLESAFLNLFCQTATYWQQIDQTKGGRLKFGVNIPILTSLLLPLPSPSEQRDIASALDACDTKIVSLEGEVTTLEEFFRALLEELMTGRLSALPLVEAAEAEVTA